MTASTLNLYPLLFEPALHTKVWGGRQLETRLGKALPADQPIGESWEIYWENRVANGEFRGKTLGELIATYPEAMVGNVTADPEFPLLIKLLDAQDWLSVQVHPDDKLAAELEGQPRGKTECWYIVDAAPDSQIVYGFSQATDAVGFRHAIESGTAKEMLQFVNVAPGDFIYVPAGTMHAIGPGLLIYELQQTSDTTYRVYDWDRMGLDGKPRDLHIDKSLKVTHYDVRPTAKVNYPQEAPQSISMLIANPYFTLNKISLKQGKVIIDYRAEGIHAPSYTLTVTKGDITLSSLSQPENTTHLTLGQSAFMPSQIGAYQIGADQDSEALMALVGDRRSLE
ncbi:MAG: type I phosphomannose isomerase catalytic subunit [Chloroflexota bacterium]